MVTINFNPHYSDSHCDIRKMPFKKENKDKKGTKTKKEIKKKAKVDKGRIEIMFFVYETRKS